MLSRQKILSIVMLIYGLVMISPVLPYLGLRGIFLVAVLFGVMLIAFRGVDLELSRWFIFSALAVLILACAPAVYWMDIRYPITAIFLVFALFLLQLSNERAVDSFITLATAFMLVLLAGGVIGFILALGGVQPLFEIPNSDGRPNYFFYTTFSKIRWGNVIRASGIYDEPGAMSFMVCAIAALRHLRGRDSKITWLMLGMGFITLSLAHLVYVILHFFAERLRVRNIVGIAATLVPLILIVGYLGGFEIVEKRLLSRVSVTETGEVIGDNRSFRMFNAAKHLRDHPQAALFGADPSCRFDQNVCKEKFPLMGENPLSPLVQQGIFISWPYYAALVVLFLAPLFGQRYVVSMAFGALLLQRPYIVGIGYSLIGLLVIATTIMTIAEERSRRPSQPRFQAPMAQSV